MAPTFSAFFAVLFAGMVIVEAKELIKGISYAPTPCGTVSCGLFQDDFMSEAAKPLWGPRGRHDLKIISQIGANHVRLYGNSPDLDHKSFLAEASALGMGVIAGMSDFPYIQMPGNCMHSNYDCYAQVKESYSGDLRNGFLTEDGFYHPALSQVIVINEADLKMPGIDSPRLFVKAIISAIDGMLDAEAEENATGQLINFTATFSFAICPACQRFTSHPALGQMWELQHGLQHPEAYGYAPRNDLSAFLRTRLTHSFNTANPAADVQSLFLSIYEEQPEFASTPILIPEYHKPGSDVAKDVADILAIADASPVLQGISFFEYQTRYDKGGTEEAFGMFGLGSYAIRDFNFFGDPYDVRCLVPAREGGSNETIPEAVTAVFGGTGVDYSMLCVPDPVKVKLHEAGYREIAAQRSAERMAAFAARIAEHLGGVVTDAAALEAFAAHYTVEAAADAWGYMVGQIAQKPAWAQWTFETACVADRRSDTAAVGSSIAWACENTPLLDCTQVPADCQGSVWDMADYIFGAYYLLAGESPLQSCYFNGDAIYAAAPLYLQGMSPPSKPRCVPTQPPPTRTTTTTTTTGRPFAGNCSFAVQPTTDYFWDVECVEAGGGAGCNADGKHLGCRWCGSPSWVACPRLLQAIPQAAVPKLRGARKL